MKHNITPIDEALRDQPGREPSSTISALCWRCGRGFELRADPSCSSEIVALLAKMTMCDGCSGRKKNAVNTHANLSQPNDD
jgi:hypothetical protein